VTASPGGSPPLAAVYGVPLPEVDVVEVPVEVAERFAAAHHRLRPESVGVHLGDGEVRVTATAAVAADAEAVVDDVVARIRDAGRPIVVAGPEVVRRDAVDGLHALAVALSAGVLNTWGAKGVFDWRSRHHLATVGLQAWDLDRGGLADADLIVTTGLDAAELPEPLTSDGWRGIPVVDIAPGALVSLAARVARPEVEIPFPPLRDRLAQVTRAGWARDGAPLAPTRVTQAYGSLVEAGGVVAADPGVAGFWVARTLPTTALRSVVVPADPDEAGAAIATAVVARLLDPSRPALAVVDELGEPGRLGLEAAARLGVPVAVERWSPDGDLVDAAAHAERLARIVADGGTVSLATDPTQLDDVVAVAGPVTAWRSRTGSEEGRTSRGSRPGDRWGHSVAPPT